ncbi:MAG: cytochrome C oxidase subunit II [Candidatus Pristimantibacillus lignocellulolyticus]|uniref:Cytochrome C oxidase subunit II n=1 Tax=Candidatus Pristimantibacillus lignocellulolyticus TaxID=2994561 RepID=A0A9J6ZE63_9BACL|nr:MAG: cytochrome C oxidase subunit II [Candidatus Pristimantibacillus lignocellulolyticus]
MQKWIMLALVSIAAVMAASLLAFGLPEKPKTGPEELPEGVNSIMKIEANEDFTFNQAEFTAKAGETVILKFSNKSGLHGIDIAKLIDSNGVEVKLNKDNPETQVTFTEAKEYLIECNIPCGQGHKTMHAKLIITAA